MPKLKTHRGAAKRFKISAKGKVIINHCNKSHILTKKDRKRKRRLRQHDVAFAGDAKVIKRMMPYV